MSRIKVFGVPLEKHHPGGYESEIRGFGVSIHRSNWGHTWSFSALSEDGNCDVSELADTASAAASAGERAVRKAIKDLTALTTLRAPAKPTKKRGRK